ncbi:hypothetical protein [Xanthobacter dioxanivorans]|uniref:hypothetical protein n=1 Tax=Xanthobacter dioxanivorans TaxID=2528964 RepID=UPI001E3AF609|nr:hypothetical protein [Xanthobacter dioxanivorans]
MNNVPSQRVGPLAALPDLLNKQGVSLDEAFAGSGIEPSQLVPDPRFPYPALSALVERSAIWRAARISGSSSARATITALSARSAR